MKNLYAITVALFLFCQVKAQQVIYTQADSVKVVSLLNKVKELPLSIDRMVFFGKQFSDIPYVANTLDKGNKEQLIINLQELDCTTFVETATALALASRKTSPRFDDFMNALRLIRYRDGKLDGYPSRLHYFSDWIQDNMQKGVIKDVTAQCGKDSLVLNPFFMSANPDKYIRLRSCATDVKRIKEAEEALQGKRIRYFAKTDLDNSQVLRNIKEGDIIAIVTSIKGLDIAHVGIATYENGELHLLHASSKHMKVVVERVNLFTQLKNNRTQMGIRVMRMR